jgi:hypothetical protein
MASRGIELASDTIYPAINALHWPRSGPVGSVVMVYD